MDSNRFDRFISNALQPTRGAALQHGKRFQRPRMAWDLQRRDRSHRAGAIPANRGGLLYPGGASHPAADTTTKEAIQ